MMGFIARTVGRAVVSTVVSAVVTLAVKEVAERRMKRKQAVPRLTDQRGGGAGKRPAQRAKSPDAIADAAE